MILNYYHYFSKLLIFSLEFNLFIKKIFTNLNFVQYKIFINIILNYFTFKNLIKLLASNFFNIYI